MHSLKNSYLGWLNAGALQCLFEQFDYPCEYYKLLEAYPELHRFLEMWTVPQLWFNLKFSIGSDPTKVQFIGCDQPSTYPRSDLPSDQLVNYEILRPKNYTPGPTFWVTSCDSGIMGVTDNFDAAVKVFLDDVDSCCMNDLIDKYAEQLSNSDRNAFQHQDEPKTDTGFLEWLNDYHSEFVKFTGVDAIADECATGSIDGPNGLVYFIEVPTGM
jgi:hypothetical protein